MSALSLVASARAPSGPRGRPILGNLRELREDPCGLFLRSVLEHGGLVRIRVAHLYVYVVSDPAYVKRVLTDHMRNYVKGPSYQSLRYLLGDGLLVAEGELWRRQRRLMNPAFARQALANKIPVMASVAYAFSARWDARASSGESFDLVAEMMSLAFEVMGKALLGADVAAEMAEVSAAMPDAARWVYGHLQAPVKLPLWLPTANNLRFKRSRRVLQQVVQRVIDKHRRGEGASDLLTMLIDSRDDSGDSLSDRELRDQLLTALLAGHETTGSMLSWIYLLLAEHPEVEARLLAELDAVLGSRPPTAEDVPRLVYTGQVINEALRLYPPAWSFTRTALGDDLLGPYRIPKGSIVVISPWVNQRHPDYFQAPERFDPERFAPERQRSIDTYHYFPFGGGPHLCIGKFLSLYETKIALAVLARRHRLVRSEQGPLGIEAGITLRPAGAVPVRVERRPGKEHSS